MLVLKVNVPIHNFVLIIADGPPAMTNENDGLIGLVKTLLVTNVSISKLCCSKVIDFKRVMSFPYFNQQNAQIEIITKPTHKTYFILGTNWCVCGAKRMCTRTNLDRFNTGSSDTDQTELMPIMEISYYTMKSNG